MLGLVLTGFGVYIAYLGYARSLDSSRPALDVIKARLIQRSHVTFKDQQIAGEFDRLELTIQNKGTVEATQSAVPTTAWDEVAQIYKDAGKRRR